ncbi:Tripartite-type tricarboxylate transporter, receptor component TctC [Gemmobacter megaterium]|uniref:Tripartite-type tricarboxylate transporter, receptor component TctC n=1 Tax=Gemmobacter megaterium TaxID=1086013 RepID=A0A1N7QQR3_9RHOB|nr:tripartite tricarboxylate transporter substrate binding protein [Gemmobacter megaterium]GGE28663.1 hypothetical protein GCM10011345_38410 [Gemmobacter megaterium]SIT25114.1 Tripartite-type tricarboxylate transporter, receptor component TctC [Gemmobacter megaterium]
MFKTLKAAALIALTVASPALADWPERPISLIVGFGPGGQSDLLGRALASVMAEELGVPVNVVNRPGAAGGAALAGLRSMPADGYNIMLNPTQTITLTPALMAQVPFSIDDFSFAGMLTSFDIALIAPTSAPFDDYAGMIAHTRENPGLLFAALSATTRIFATEIARANDISIEILPVDGGPGMVNAILGEQALLAYSGGVHHRYPEQMKVIAALTTERNAGSPDVPTIAELGLPIGMDMQTVLIAPAGTPDDVIARLEATLATAAENPAFREVADSMSAVVQFRTAAEATEIMHKQLASNLAIMRAAGVQPQ